MDFLPFLMHGAVAAANASAKQPAPTLPNPPPTAPAPSGGDQYLMNSPMMDDATPGPAPTPGSPPVGTRTGPNQVQEAVVTAGPSGYGNTGSVTSVMQANKHDQPMDAAPANDAWGLVPGLGHGMVRNIIGNITDGLSMLTGGAPQYRMRMNRIEDGRATVGYGQLGHPQNADGSDMTADQIGKLTDSQKRDIIYDNSMKAADRLAALGHPGALAEAQQMREQAARMYESGTTAEYSHEYHNSLISSRQEGIDNNNWNHIETQDGRKRSTYDAMITAAQRLGDANKFALAQARVSQMIAADGEHTHISPNEYSGDMNSWNPANGLTSGQLQSSTDKGLGRENALKIAGIYAGSREAAARIAQITKTMQPNQVARIQELEGKWKAGTLSYVEGQELEKALALPKGARRPHGITGGPVTPPPTSGPQRGFKQGGYTFIGGDPSNPSNWKKG